MKRVANKNKSSRRKRSTLIILSTLLISISLSLVFGAFFSSAKDESIPLQKYYMSIEIQSGDSLWSICEEYMPEHYNSIYEYMDEVAEINQIDFNELDSIYEGDFLTISYYK